MSDETSDETMVVSAPATRGPKVSFERERGVYAIHVTRDIAHVIVYLGTDGVRSDRIQRVFRTMADAGTSIFLVKLHRRAVSFALVAADVSHASEALRALGLDTKTRVNLASVAVLAASMRAVSGVMVDISDSLFAVGARLYGTGDSHDSVLCLIEAERVDAAVDRLCEVFHLDASAVTQTHLAEVTQ
jgi:aspartate kinase